MTAVVPSPSDYRTLSQLRLADLEAIRLVLRGGSVIDWHRLNFELPEEAEEFIRVHELRMDNEADVQRTEAVKREAVDYLRRNLDFPVPRPVAELPLVDLLMLAAGRGHRQVCACAILKVMHIIHHLEGRELLFMLPVSDREVFYLVEEKVYRVIGDMLAHGFPIVEFLGGRKNKDSLYTKLLSKHETVAANVYDKLRFRIVTRTRDDIFPILNYILKRISPFNYVVPGQSTNTLVQFRRYCEGHAHLAKLFKNTQLAPDIEEAAVTQLDNRFSDPAYATIHFVVDMPIRLPDAVLEAAPPPARGLGAVAFVQTEFQIVDEPTDQQNEVSSASHAAYKERQKRAVARRLKVGNEDQQRTPEPNDDNDDGD